MDRVKVEIKASHGVSLKLEARINHFNHSLECLIIIEHKQNLE